jgi:hypothetical protein
MGNPANGKNGTTMTPTVDIGSKVDDLKRIMESILEKSIFEDPWDVNHCTYCYTPQSTFVEVHKHDCLALVAKEWLKYIEDYENETKSI